MCLSLNVIDRVPVPQSGIGWKVVEFRPYNNDFIPISKGSIKFPSDSESWTNYNDKQCPETIPCRWEDGWHENGYKYPCGIHVFLRREDAVEAAGGSMHKIVVSVEWDSPVAFGTQPRYWRDAEKYIHPKGLEDTTYWPASCVVVKRVRRMRRD